MSRTEPDIAEATPARTDRYILLAEGPFAYLRGSEGEQYITATRGTAGGGSPEHERQPTALDPARRLTQRRAPL